MSFEYLIFGSNYTTVITRNCGRKGEVNGKGIRCPPKYIFPNAFTSKMFALLGERKRRFVDSRDRATRCSSNHLDFVQMRLNFVQMHLDFVPMRLDFLPMHLDFVQMRPDFVPMHLGCISLGKILIRILNPKTDFLFLWQNPKKDYESNKSVPDEDSMD